VHGFGSRVRQASVAGPAATTGAAAPAAFVNAGATVAAKDIWLIGAHRLGEQNAAERERSRRTASDQL